MKTTGRVHASGKVTIPSEIRREYGIEDGDLVEFEVTDVEKGGD